MKAGVLWGRMVSCGGLAIRLPRVGVPSNRGRTADFRECRIEGCLQVADLPVESERPIPEGPRGRHR